MSEAVSPAEYRYDSGAPDHTHQYLWAPVIQLCRDFGAKRIFDLGCGNGAFCRELDRSGFETAGCDPSLQGIDQARIAEPKIPFTRLGVDDDPLKIGDQDFDAVVSLEVIEHLYLPRQLPRFAAKILRPGGRLIVSTPYHGYLKDLVLAVAGKWELHHSPHWDGGHIKFWTRRTLSDVLGQEGFRVMKFIGVGRAPLLWKSMIMVGEKE